MARLRQRYDVAESGRFYNGGLWGNSLPVVVFEEKNRLSLSKTFK